MISIIKSLQKKNALNKSGRFDKLFKLVLLKFVTHRSIERSTTSSKITKSIGLLNCNFIKYIEHISSESHSVRIS